MYTTGYIVGMLCIGVLGTWGFSVIFNWEKVTRRLLLVSWMGLLLATLILLLAGK
jgi:hypothetical protein